jgi:hypothetical protein
VRGEYIIFQTVSLVQSIPIGARARARASNSP